MQTQSISKLDPKALQLKVGLEVHQQLATKEKLFCPCPPFSIETALKEPDLSKLKEFTRILRPVTSELGELDEAAKFESRREILARYVASPDTSCLVEADEEPPHPINEEALETSLLFALALKSKIADEIHVMRKIVVDGSNTSGFQRTAVVALGGELIFNSGKSRVGVQSISVEEDAARAVEKPSQAGAEAEEFRTYALDRLGTPLVEVALAPIEGTPYEVEDAARTLGRLMRSTRRVARGLGTIRQDLNISVMGGKVIEVKGVQKLDQINKVVLFEASRQKFFYDLGKEVSEKIGAALHISIHVATDIFRQSKSNVIKKALSSDDGSVFCIAAKKFSGYFGKENEFHSRLGKELGAIAKSYGLGGVFQSDELPNYGITDEEISLVRSNFELSSEDGFVLIAGSQNKALRAADALRIRITHVPFGVTAETRSATEEGETVFLRPRPGAARMYPETDIPLIRISKLELLRLEKLIPEPWDVQVDRYGKKYDLPHQLAEPLFDSERKALFEEIVKSTKLPSRYIASTLVDTFLSLSRDGVQVHLLTDENVLELFRALDLNLFAKEALPDIIRQLSSSPGCSLKEAISKAGVSLISEDELGRIVDQIISENLDLVRSKGPTGAQSALMGRVMQKVRGKADGKLVSELVTRKLAALSEKTKH